VGIEEGGVICGRRERRKEVLYWDVWITVVVGKKSMGVCTGVCVGVCLGEGVVDVYVEGVWEGLGRRVNFYTVVSTKRVTVPLV
jgi:hypothetical protein